MGTAAYPPPPVVRSRAAPGWGNSKKGGRVSVPQYKGLLLLYWGRAAGVLAVEEYVLEEKNIL
jgi:hypothetical protein